MRSLKIATKNKRITIMKMNNFTIIAIATLSLAVTAWLIARPFPLSGDCMEPAVKDGQLCFLNQTTPYLKHYQINDIIVFSHEGKDWISRIVALEGNTIKITEGSIIVNDVALNDAGISRNWSGWNFGTNAIDQSLQVPINHVFVLSDNLSAQHDDSRVFGPIPNSSILGSVW